MSDISQEDELFDRIVKTLGIERRLATTSNLIKRDKVINELRKYGDSRELEGRKYLVDTIMRLPRVKIDNPGLLSNMEYVAVHKIKFLESQKEKTQ